MSHICEELHWFVNTLPRFYYPYEEKDIPLNGLCLYFENGERGHGEDRIVMIGSHNRVAQLRDRLKEHFEITNKDRSMFRKSIGRSILNVRKDPYLKIWDLDMTNRENREKYSHLINEELQSSIEQEVTWYIRDNFSFSVIEVEDKEERKALKFKLAATISSCSICRPSINWLGLNSPKEKIKESGLWQEQGLNGEPFTELDLERIKKICKNGLS